jgi:hypothetical protein
MRRQYILFTKRTLCKNGDIAGVARQESSMIERTIFSAEHEAFRDGFRRFMDKEIHHTTSRGKSRAWWTGRC